MIRSKRKAPIVRDHHDQQVDAPTRKTRPWRYLSVGVVILFGLVIIVALGSRFGTDPNLVGSVVVDRPVPSLQMPRLGAEGSLSLDDFKGDVLVVNFWASWCLACRAEHDDLLAAAAKYRSAGVHFVGISFQDRTSDAMAMLDELGWGYDYVTDPDNQAAFTFGIRGVPETFFVDRDGMIVDRLIGESTLATLSAKIEGVLDPPPDQDQPAP